MRFLLMLNVIFTLIFIPLSSVSASTGDAEDVFQRYSGAAVKIHVVNEASGAKSVIGTGFFVSDSGYLVTNYHVISKWLHEPDKHRVEYLDENKQVHQLQVLNIDVVNDLAVARTAGPVKTALTLSQDKLAQGAKIFSFGFPHDFGITIVEGTYNGLLEHAYYNKIHFTGSLNSGMSGGPALDASGHVVGINVATSGNQVSFLVPVEYAIKLYDATIAEGFVPPDSFVKRVEQQLKAHQQVYVADSLFDGAHQVELGEFLVPTTPARFFNCWGGASDSDSESSQYTSHQCSAEDYLYISSEHGAAPAFIRHSLLVSSTLNDYQFANLYSRNFGRNPGSLWEGSDHVTPFRCQSDALAHNELAFKTAFCVRRYRKMDGLYDAVFKLVTLGDSQRGVVSELVLFGVAFETAVEVSKRYLELFSWKK
ncbi:serine protease [Pseudomonadota bacterium]